MASQVIGIKNQQGELTGYITEDAKMTGSFFRAYHFAPGPHVEIIARQFCMEHKGITFVGGVEVEFDFTYEIIDDVVPQL